MAKNTQFFASPETGQPADVEARPLVLREAVECLADTIHTITPQPQAAPSNLYHFPVGQVVQPPEQPQPNTMDWQQEQAA